MAILKIARMGHPVLRRRADPVADPTAPEIRQLVRDMVETVHDADGAGLAAPQVHVPLRVVVFHVPGSRLAEGEAPDPEEGKIHVLINPVIEPLGEEQVSGWEGCLSVPGFRGVVPRWKRLRYRAVGLDGKEFTREVEGFHARVVQHECDHLDGILYPMRMPDLTLLGFEEEMSRYPLGRDDADDEIEEEEA
ncbi:MAG TPA: peptide deformylase [Alphaproteobacteria bacterium]|jgi:peptide deformylase|nr:peptide deformylase [Alphaproteobacteria bacterium]